MAVNYPTGTNARIEQQREKAKRRTKKLENHVKNKSLGIKPEHEIQDEIRYMLALHGHDVFRANVGLMKSEDGKRAMSTGLPAGFPDLFGSRKGDGKMFFIEVKNSKGKRRPKQIIFAKERSEWPIIYGVARSAEEALMIVEQGLNRTADPKHTHDID